MSNTIGERFKLTIFGESHGPYVGCVIDGLPGGIQLDLSYIDKCMAQRKAEGTITTSRIEKDQVQIISGFKDGKTTGSPLTILIANQNTRSSDYDQDFVPRPGHADYVAYMKSFQSCDLSGGGHFSGRLTAPLVAAGSIFAQCLEKKGILIATHIHHLDTFQDRDFDFSNFLSEKQSLEEFPILHKEAKEALTQTILQVKNDQDSLGGCLQTAVVGLDVGFGEPFFDTIEGNLAKMLFAIPAVKGVSFGDGFGFAKRKGSEVNDEYTWQNGKVITCSNHNGGVNGGISNGMPIVFQTVLKPTPSIGKTQRSVNLKDKTDCELKIHGRHDPCIVPRASIVVSMATAFVIADFIAQRYGNEWFVQ